MKHLYTSLALIGIVFASHAQQPSSENSEGKKFDKSQSQRVASPNRTSSREWARSHKSHKSAQHNGDKDSSQSAAVLWVDSTGKTVGRALGIGGGDSNVLVTFDNGLIALTGLVPERTCGLNAVCTFTFSGGANWNSFSSVLYTSTDCTGDAYISSIGTGRPINGIPIFDNGETFIYLYDLSKNISKTILSVFSNGSCSTSFSNFPQDVSPVTAVVPASVFGVTPFFLK